MAAASSIITPLQTTRVGSAAIISWAYLNGSYGCTVYVDKEINSSWSLFGCDAADFEDAERAYTTLTGKEFGCL